MIRVGQLQLVDPPGQCQTETQDVSALLSGSLARAV
jgi:hypothetical protein